MADGNYLEHGGGHYFLRLFIIIGVGFPTFTSLVLVFIGRGGGGTLFYFWKGCGGGGEKLTYILGKFFIAKMISQKSGLHLQHTGLLRV